MTSAALPSAPVAVVEREYPVSIGAGTRHEAAITIALVAPAHHFAVISDETVGSLYGEALAAALAEQAHSSLHTIVPGERHKTRESWATLTDRLLDAGCGRDTTIVALGGGVVGDLAGFVAATYMRGVPYVQCPTSLLAMIDASVGGKTGVDTPAGKNLVGAFHPPAAVLADVEVIGSLPMAHRRAGLAEAIKHGIVADAAHLARIEATLPALLDAEPGALVECVSRSVALKRAIVAQDPRESGRRRVLNFGHTLGHALEVVSGYALLHGEAVSIGMVLEARLAERRGVAPAGTAGRVREVLQRAGLPVERPVELDVEAVVRATRQDKKRVAGAVGYALPAGIGCMAGESSGWLVPVDDALVREVLA